MPFHAAILPVNPDASEHLCWNLQTRSKKKSPISIADATLSQDDDREGFPSSGPTDLAGQFQAARLELMLALLDARATSAPFRARPDRIWIGCLNRGDNGVLWKMKRSGQ
jgi:hypothetical protein